MTAANDLVGHQAPPGLILFAYTLPSVLIRAFVPYIRFPTIRFSAVPFWRIVHYLRHPGQKYTPLEKPDDDQDPNNANDDKEVNYPFRLTICSISSFIGLQLLSFSPHLSLRVLGISLTSLSSNLGDMSFYQLATRFPVSIANSFGGYAAGSGAAGLIGSGLYTALTGPGHVPTNYVLAGMGIVPGVMLTTYGFLLPDMEVDGNAPRPGKPNGPRHHSKKAKIKDLAIRDKLRLVKPMVWGYMLPLATLMLLENTTIQGILPNTLFNLPLSPPSLMGFLFSSARDFFPTYMTVYQLAVFLGRTSIAFVRLPELKAEYAAWPYWALCVVELVCFFVQLGESLSMAGMDDSTAWFGPGVVMAVMAIMGLCGGLGMSNTYWRVSKHSLPREGWEVLGEVRRRGRGGRVGRGSKDTAEVEAQAGLLHAEEVEEDEVWDVDVESRGRRLVTRRGSRGNLYGRVLERSREASPASFRLRERSPGGWSFRLDASSRSASSEVHGGRMERASEVWGVDSEAEEEQWGDSGDEDEDGEGGRKEEETALREFLISTIALPDTMAIMLASMLSLWMQPGICSVQAKGGRGNCMGG